MVSLTTLNRCERADDGDRGARRVPAADVRLSEQSRRASERGRDAVRDRVCRSIATRKRNAVLCRARRKRSHALAHHSEPASISRTVINLFFVLVLVVSFLN